MPVASCAAGKRKTPGLRRQLIKPQEAQIINPRSGGAASYSLQASWPCWPA